MASVADSVPQEANGVGRSLSVGLTCLVILVLGITGLTLWDSWRSEVRETWDRQHRLALVLAEQTSRAVQSIDLVVSACVEQIRARGINSEDALRTAMSGESVYEELRNQIRDLPQIEALVIEDAHGQAVNSSRYWPSVGID